MRELALEGRTCDVCGARAGNAYAARVESNVEARGASFVGVFDRGRVASAPRERSGLAHAAGFAGVLSLFRYPFMPLALSHVRLEVALGTWLVAGFWVLAPVALALAFAAAVSLDRSREKAGALPALFGLVAGLSGTFELLFMFEPWLRHLKAF